MPPSLFSPPTAPTFLSLLLTHPTFTLARWLYTTAPPFSVPPPSTLQPSAQTSNPIRILCISDTHNTQPADLPAADMLIHAGDLTMNGTYEELEAQVEWLKGLEGYKGGKVIVGGNHDVWLDEYERCGREEGASVDWGGMLYLSPSSTTATITFTLPRHNRTLHMYGSPLTPKYGNWAFQSPRHRSYESDVPERMCASTKGVVACEA
ncbi:hypothetical protein P3342_007957 [Pyrenophora teres f. teres]|nr:hypothetical protein P3342_007957 [Pyrenophora teres f. teres]